jgi:hypothetical protein
MPQITTIRVVRKRSIQPEQYGNTGAEVELVGNVLEGEDYKTVARQMLVDSRALVYENLGMKLPASVVAAAKELDTPQETATVETDADAEPAKEPAKKGRGRPKGSKNTRPKAGTKAAEEAAKEAATDATGDDEIPGGDEGKPQISTNPENRVDPDDIPGEDDAAEAEATDFTAEDLHAYIIAAIKADKLTTQQAKKVQQEMGVVRMRDLDTPEKVAEAKAKVDALMGDEETP